MTLKKISLACMVLGGSAFLAACGGGGGGTPITLAPAPTVTKDLAVSANASVLTAVGTAPVTFANGFSGVDISGNPVSITGSTTVAFSGGGASPNSSISNGGFTASGPTTFGSCIFTFTSSNFPSSSPFAVGKTFKVDPCSFTAKTAGASANGNTSSSTGTYTFGNSVSTPPFPIQTTISNDGTVKIGGIVIGTVTVTNVTGGGS